MKTEKVGQHIRTFMEKKGISLVALSQKTGLETDFPSTIIDEDVYPSLGPLLIKGADLTESDVKDFCRGQIAHCKIPKYVAFVNAHPLTSSGKVQQYKLQEKPVDYFPQADHG
jgi:acyl-CoA synthetase (AMP-forming)/AMP-acid ligase II